MSQFVRQTVAGNPTGNPQSYVSESYINPTEGWSGDVDVVANPSSIVSGQNVWVRLNQLQARYKLSAVSVAAYSNPGNPDTTGANPAANSLGRIQGSANYFNLPDRQIYQVIAPWDSAGNNQFSVLSNTLSGGAFGWSALSRVSSAGTDLPVSSKTAITVFGATMYGAAQDKNLLALSGYTNSPLYCWSGPATNVYSVVTGAPAAIDVCNFDNRVVAWNCWYLAGSNIPQRAQWPVQGDLMDWTGIGSGFEDLVDMVGSGTRIFGMEEQMVLCSTHEMWRGRKIGLPFVFAFSPITRQLGVPYARAAIQTPVGLFWLGYDYMVYHMVGESVQPVGLSIQQQLLDTMTHPDVAFMAWHPRLHQLRLFYSVEANRFPNRAFVYSLENRTWCPEAFTQYMTGSLSISGVAATDTPGQPGPV